MVLKFTDIEQFNQYLINLHTNAYQMIQVTNKKKTTSFLLILAQISRAKFCPILISLYQSLHAVAISVERSNQSVLPALLHREKNLQFPLLAMKVKSLQNKVSS